MGRAMNFKLLIKLNGGSINEAIGKLIFESEESLKQYYEYVDEDPANFICNIDKFSYKHLKKIYLLSDLDLVKSSILFFILFSRKFSSTKIKLLESEIDFLRQEYLKYEDCLSRFKEDYNSNINIINTTMYRDDVFTKLRYLIAYNKIVNGDDLSQLIFFKEYLLNEIRMNSIEKNFRSCAISLKIALSYLDINECAKALSRFYELAKDKAKDYNLRVLTNFVTCLFEEEVNCTELFDASLDLGVLDTSIYKKLGKSLIRSKI